MINRRHIRLKVMQSLYAYFTSNNKDLEKAQKQMLKECENIRTLYLTLLSLPYILSQFSKVFLEEQKNKYFTTNFDKNPSERFENNQIVKLILEDKMLLKEMDKVSWIWKNSDHDLIRKLFVKIWKSNLYKDYCNASKTTFEKDKQFLLGIFDKNIIDDELLHHILEEESIFWTDDLPFVGNIIYSQIKATKNKESKICFSTTFKNKEDKEFAMKLLRKTILNHKEFEEVIRKKAKNWDLERIARMDQILLMMALCELMYFTEIPIKVSLNEYIEVAKYYSTNKSKGFINGILDKVISEYKKSGKIKKVGRGLLE